MDHNDESGNASVPNTVECIFDFFNLSRELRDMIYEETLTEEEKLPGHFPYCLYLRNVPHQSLLLVSHQFRQELLERVTRSNYIAADDEGATYADKPPPRLPSRVENICHLQMNLVLDCSVSMHGHRARGCSVLSDLIHHGKIIKGLLRILTAVRSVSLNLHLRPHRYVKKCEVVILDQQSLVLAPIAEKCRISSANVYHCEYYNLPDIDDDWNLWKEKKLVMKYSDETGRLQHVYAEREDKNDTAAMKHLLKALEDESSTDEDQLGEES